MNTNPCHSFAIIPAAGESRRMGQPKLLLPWGEKNVIETVIAAWQASRVERLLVVVHPTDNALAECCRAAGVHVVIPKTPPPDMRASLCAGIEALQHEFQPSSNDVLLVAPADLPNLSPGVVDLLLDTHQATHPSILVPLHDGQRGHPVLLPWDLAAAIQQLPETAGLNSLLTCHRVIEVACSQAGTPEDIDTPEDYQRLRQRRQDG